MKSRIRYGQLVRAIGSDWTFRACWSMFDFKSRSFLFAETSRVGARWWPEYLLESA